MIDCIKYGIKFLVNCDQRTVTWQMTVSASVHSPLITVHNLMLPYGCGLYVLDEAAAEHEGEDVGVAAHEVAEEHGGVFGAAFGEHFATEGLGGGFVEDAVFLEFREHVGIEHLGPFV